LKHWSQRIFRLAHQFVIGAALVTILASLSGLVALIVFDQRVERFTLGLRPPQFLGMTEEDILANHTDIFGVGHNSGDTINTAIQAIVHGADVVEIDVVLSDGELYAGHNAPNRIFGQTSFRGSRLRDAWVVASAAGTVQLDLKGSSQTFIDQVGSFLTSRQRFPALVLSASDPNVLRQLSEQAPHAVLLLSVSSSARYISLQSEPETIALIDGVSIRDDLVTEASASWFREQELQIWAWTVNQPTRAAELAAIGIDGVTTDNLAILEALSGGGPDNRQVERKLAATEQPTEDQGETGADDRGGN
jgi:hypothetical protein